MIIFGANTSSRASRASHADSPARGLLSRFLPVLLLCLTACAATQYPNITLKAPPKPAIDPDYVQVVHAPPPGSQLVALVYAWSNVPVDSRIGYDRAVFKLRERAASIGAEALWVPPFEQMGWPSASVWTGPGGHDRSNMEDARPNELMGRALDLADAPPRRVMPGRINKPHR